MSLIKFSLYIFHCHKDIKLKWQQRLEYIMIDEFQDIDQIQYQLMEVLCGYHRTCLWWATRTRPSIPGGS